MIEESIIKEIRDLNNRLNIAKKEYDLKTQLLLKEKINNLENKAKFYEIKNLEMESVKYDKHKRR